MGNSINMTIWFDVEDYITPQSDKALDCILDMLDKRGIRGTFKIVGEKARVLKERGRSDIIEKLKRHDIGYHTDYHSRHPVIIEYEENMGFASGSLEFERREWKGFSDVTRIMGRYPVAYGQPGFSWAPQVYPVLRKWSVPVYLDCNDFLINDEKPFWYGGLLNLTDMHRQVRLEFEGNSLFDAIKAFDTLHDELTGDGTAFISIYYHPCEFATEEFWDGVNFSNGVNSNLEQWVIPKLRSEEEMSHYISLLGSFLDYIMESCDVEFLTASEIMGLEKSTPEKWNMEKVKYLSRNISDEVSFMSFEGHMMAASEIFSLLAGYVAGGSLNDDLIYGPENFVASKCADMLGVAAVKNSLRINYPTVMGYKMLPDFFEVEGSRINPVDMFCTLAKIIREDLKDDDEVHVVKGKYMPGNFVRKDEHFGRKWIILDKEYRAPNIIKMAELQAWTLKPAMFE